MSCRTALRLVALVGVAAASSTVLAQSPAAGAQRPGPPAITVADASTPPGQAAAPGPDTQYTPPACAGIFTDVACPGGFAVNWIERFYNDGITSGCNAAPLEYCPDAAVTRAQMAVFVEKAVRGTAAWSPGDVGNYSTALGYEALMNNAGALENVAIGSGSLAYTTTGQVNTAIGANAGQANGTGSYNTYVGNLASATGGGFQDATAIGNEALVDASYHVRIGDTNVTQIGGQVAWSNLSDARAKTDIRDLDLGLDFVLALRPVAFTMKSGNGRTDMGFIAQEVEALVGEGYNVLGIGGDKERTLSLRYTDLIAPMAKAIQEQQAQLDAKDARIAELEANAAAQQSRLDGQAAQLEALLARMARLEAAAARTADR